MLRDAKMWRSAMRSSIGRTGPGALALGVGLAVMLGGTAIAEELSDPLSPLTTTKGAILCFERDYSAVHLAQHPKQTTKSILLAFEQRFVTIVLRPRTGAEKRIYA